MNKLLKIRKKYTPPTVAPGEELPTPPLEEILYQEVVSPAFLQVRQHMFQVQCDAENLTKCEEYYELTIDDTDESAVDDPEPDPVISEPQ